MRNIVVKVLNKALKEERINLKPKEIDSFIEIPPDSEMGDFAFPCFYLASKLKMTPHEVALQIRQNIGTPPKAFQDIRVSGGYVNFVVDRKKFTESIIKEVILQKQDYGKLHLGRGEKVLVEHTSINPNASPHVGRARNAIIGDSIVRILRFMDYKPEVHYYVNDVSKQIAMLVLAKAEKLNFDSMLKAYSRISKKVSRSQKMELEVFSLLEEFEKGNKTVSRKFKKIVDTCVKGQKEILGNLGINYDVFDYESSYLSKTKHLLTLFEKTKKLFKDKEGRIVLDQKGTSVQVQMKSPILVLTRSNGTGLYPVRDLAYTIDKIQQSKKNILVLGEDQKLYFQQIKEALALLKLNAPQVVHYSYILLRKKGKRKSKKMSTRKGDVVLLEDFLEEATKKAKKEIKKRKTSGNPKKVAIAAVKYSILKNHNNKVINFDLDEALRFEGDTGPYLLYSYARANSILKKSKIKPILKPRNELHEVEYALIKKISLFHDVVYKAHKNLNPSLIANYSYQLAQIFNEFYHSCKVVGDKEEFFRIAVVEIFKQVLGNALKLLGIEPIEKM
ncbi:MAG: arginine--tRNA ligase [Candidatus Nanoarchaeia archaeon]